METRKCPNCNKVILRGILYCPYCGQKQSLPYSAGEIHKDPYQILMVSKDAEDEVIEAAYKSLARKYHPDTASGQSQSDRMVEINWAYEILKDPIKRSEWDKDHIAQQQSIKTEKEPKVQYPKQDHTDQKPSQDQAPPTVPKKTGEHRWLQAVGLFLLIVTILLCVLSIIRPRQTNLSPNIENVADTTRAPSPVYLPTKVPTQRPTKFVETQVYMYSDQPSCIRWDRVTNFHIGRKICVYGVIAKIQSTDSFTFILRFSDEAGTLLIRSRNMFYEGVTKDMCVAAEGPIRTTGTYYYMEVEETELYEYSNCD